MKRVAFIGRAGHTLPSHRALLNCIALRWSVTLYSEVPIDPEWLKLEHHYQLRPVMRRNLPRRLRDLLLFITLIRDHLKHRFHIVHAHSTYPTGLVAVVFQTLFRVPAIVSLDAAEASALPEIGFGDLLSHNRRRLNGWVIRRARMVTALTKFHRDEVIKNLGIKRTILVIPRGVDPDKFFPQMTVGKSTAVVLLSVGYINPIKDPDTLVYAFREIQKKIDCQLIVVGRDYTNGAAEMLVRELNLSHKVRFENYVESDLMPSYYRQANILIHSSRYESQGMAVAEAMASGVVVVGTRVGLISDLAPECCIAVEPGNPVALAQAVVNLLTDKQTMSRIRSHALAWSQSNSLNVSCNKLMKIYQQLADSK